MTFNLETWRKRNRIPRQTAILYHNQATELMLSGGSYMSFREAMAKAAGVDPPMTSEKVVEKSRETAKLDWKKARLIRYRYKLMKRNHERGKLNRLAEEFGISYRQVWAILSYKAWVPKSGAPRPVDAEKA